MRAMTRSRLQGAGGEKTASWVTPGGAAPATDGWAGCRGVVGAGLGERLGTNLGKLAVGPVE